ncbi:MAG TPA: hypothetical protein VG672_18825, partial [Bryobacteraceae bacterium]|nr:hypothetical protein [Bryobacteraceae bacterium]
MTRRAASIGMILAAMFPSGLRGEPDQAALLERARAKIVENIQRLPKYACLQTVHRSRSQTIPSVKMRSCGDWDDRAKMRWPLMLAWTDRFKADVTVSGGTEVFSWAVPQRFQSEDVEKILSRGMTGSGDFGPFLMSIFDREAARYEYQGLESGKGPDLAVYRYRVPGSSSHYQVRVGPKAQDLATLAYEGRFWIDPRTAELVRMTIEVPRPPRQAQTCRIETTIDYRRARIGASDFLLPLSTVVRLSDPEGQRYENRIEYASCREFQSESVFRTDVDLPSGPAATPKPPLPIGPGALVRVALRSRIDSETAFAGDAIEGRLVNP